MTSSASTIEGTQPDLSNVKATVTWSNGTTTQAPVTWTKLDPSAFKAGTVSVPAAVTVDDKTFNITVQVTVAPATITRVSLSPETVTVASGTDPQAELAKIVATAIWNNGTTTTPKVTWAKVAEADYGKRAGGPFSVHGRIAGFAQGVDAAVNVTPASITGVENPADITVPVGATLTLPGTVSASYSNGEKNVPVSVTWSPSTVDTSRPDTYPLDGTVEGWDQKVALTVKVTEATIVSVTNPTGISANAGDGEADLKLPEAVKVTMSDGATSNASVTWASLTEKDKETLASREGGHFTLVGTVAGTNQTATLEVTVNPATAKDAVIRDAQGDPVHVVETESGKLPTLPEKAAVTWSNGDQDEQAITWQALNKDDFSKREGGSVVVNGQVAGREVKVTVVVAPAEPVKPAADEIAVKTIAGTRPELPTTVTVIWSNGDETDEVVTWDDYAEAKYAEENVFAVNGTVTVALPAAAMDRDTEAASQTKSFPVKATVTVVAKSTTPEEPGNGGADNGGTDQPGNGGSDSGGTEQPGNGGTDKPRQPGGNTDNGSAPAGEQGTNKPADKAAGGKKTTKVVKGKSLAKTGVDALGLGVAVIALAGLGGAAAVTARKRAH